jgi:hypothetical protein
LSDDDRQAVVEIARRALVPFEPQAESEVKRDAERGRLS